MENINVWVYIGVIGSGKDYNAQKKQKETGGKLYSFSEGVREFTFGFLGWKPKSKDEYEKFKQSNFRICLPDGCCNIIQGRKFLENVGSTLRKYTEDFWANYATYMCEIDILNNNVKDLIFYDCRYLNEAEHILKLKEVFPYMNITFIFTDYKSDRYEIRNDESEFFAQKLLSLGVKDQEDITEIVKELIYERTN